MLEKSPAAALYAMTLMALICGFCLVLLFSTTKAVPRDEAAEPPSDGPTAVLPTTVVRPENAAPAPDAKPKGKYAPGYNFALAENGATATGGRSTEFLNDGNTTGYTLGTGYATTLWRFEPREAFVVTLKETTQLNTIRFLLWDLNERRYYRYTLETSPDLDGENWKMVADRSDPGNECRRWQVIRFEPQTVRRIRLTGTHNSDNSRFYVVELEAYIDPPDNLTATSEGTEF